MKRLLPLALLALLLLAPTATGGDIDNIKSDLRDVEVQLQYLEDMLGKAEDPQKRAQLMQQVATARAHKSKLEADLVMVRGLLAEARKRYAELSKRSEAMTAKLTARRDQARKQQQELIAKGDVRGDLRRAVAMGLPVQVAERHLLQALDVQNVLAGVEAHLREGALHATQTGLTQAATQLDELDRLIAKQENMERAAAAAEHAAEDAQVARTADEIAKRSKEAAAGIETAKAVRAGLLEALKKASDPEDVEKVKRVQERMARFEEHAAKYHVAKGWLEKARALLDAQDVLEAQKALVQAKLQLQRAARAPLDDGSYARAKAEYKTQRANLDLTRAEGADPAAAAHAAALRTQIAELVAQQALLKEKVTELHPSYRQLKARIDVLKERLKELEPQPAAGTSQVIIDKDGRYELVWKGDGKSMVRLVPGKHVVVAERVVVPERVAGPTGVVIQEAPKVLETAKSVVTRVWTPYEAATRKRLHHLREAAKHLREVGQVEQAERLEKQAKDLEANFRRAAHVQASSARDAMVMKAIRDLHQEVRLLRREVKELRKLVLESR